MLLAGNSDGGGGEIVPIKVNERATKIMMFSRSELTILLAKSVNHFQLMSECRFSRSGNTFRRLYILKNIKGGGDVGPWILLALQLIRLAI